MPLQWYGKQVSAHITVAAMTAVNETTEAAASDAEQDHWWVNRTDQLESEVINEHAKLLPPGIVSGKFGSTRKRGFYGYFLELKHPFLRPAADRVFPTLAARMRRNLMR